LWEFIGGFFMVGWEWIRDSLDESKILLWVLMRLFFLGTTFYGFLF
jgi:hypothetical protein